MAPSPTLEIKLNQCHCLCRDGLFRRLVLESRIPFFTSSPPLRPFPLAKSSASAAEQIAPRRFHYPRMSPLPSQPPRPHPHHPSEPLRKKIGTPFSKIYGLSQWRCRDALERDFPKARKANTKPPPKKVSERRYRALSAYQSKYYPNNDGPRDVSDLLHSAPPTSR